MNWSQFYKNKLTLRKFFRITIAQMYLLYSILKYKPRNILEVGFGTLSNSVFLATFTEEIVSIDNDVCLVKKANCLLKDKSKPNINLIAADAFNLSFKDDSFDCVFSQGLLEHFSDKDIKKILKEQLRVGKKVIIGVPNDNYPKQDFGNERLMSKEKWDVILGGFNIIKSKYYGRLRTWYGWEKLFLGKPVEIIIIIDKME